MAIGLSGKVDAVVGLMAIVTTSSPLYNAELAMADANTTKEIEITGWAPGTLGQVVALHGRYYARDWGFGPYFEAKVAAGMARFIPRLDPDQDLFLAARRGAHLLGSITVDGSETEANEAHIRWFITSDAARGTGIGRRLMDQAMAFSDKVGFDLVYLDTFKGLDAARHLYESHGFTLVSEHADTTWGVEVTEQRFERRW
jgi:ribosomal protein S18 acetylase RimI-like enzyme